ncbi:MAG: phosphotransferase [Actinomycetota bacterium]|nr:phosphotransferase [Actinomycetota bacterium]
MEEPAAFLRWRFGLRVRSIVPVGGGWDSDTWEVDGRWIFQFPRRPEVAERIRAGIPLLPELARALSVSIPRFEFVSLEPVCVGYPKLEGDALPSPPPPCVAPDIGRLLSELHAFPVERACGLGVVANRAEGWRSDWETLLSEFRERVFPLLEPGERRAVAEIFEEYLSDERSFRFKPALIHGDLGPEHLLWNGERLTGVIDWSDARIGDPALDFAWLLHGPDESFAETLVLHYPQAVDPDFRRRARFYHRLGPWHEVVYGLGAGAPAFVASGLDGVRERLASGPRRKMRPGTGP